MGRRSVERERVWREAVAAWRRGGASVRAFCAGRGLSEPAFYCWRRELERRDAERDSGGDEGRVRAAEGATKRTVTSAELAMLLDGVDLASVRRGKRYRLPTSVRAEAGRSETARAEAAVS